VLGAAGSVDLDGTAAEAAAGYDDNQTLLLASERIGVLAAFFLFAFSAGLGRTLRRAEGPRGWLGGAALMGGAAAAVLLIAAVGFGGIAVHEGVCAHDPSASDCSGAEGSLDSGAFSILDALGFEFIVLAAIPLAVLLAATSIVVRRTESLPRWLGTVAGVLAVLFPIATIVKFAALVLYAPLLVWIVAVSVTCARPATVGANFPTRS
jgi:uncharacterized membrane protein YhaH (DUF805 family)